MMDVWYWDLDAATSMTAWLETTPAWPKTPRSGGTAGVSANLFNALVVRDRHCRFPGCDRPAAWSDAHHVVHVEDGGPTFPSNCVLLCRRHHRRLHRKGWSAELKADGELVVNGPNGRVFVSHPPGNLPRPPPALFAA